MADPDIGRVCAVVTRAEAKAAGLKRFFTGKPCKQGHVAERATANKGCCECAAIAGRKRYENNKEKIDGYRRDWAFRNREKTQSYCKAWRTKYPERHKAAYTAWRTANKERVKATFKKYYEATRERQLAYTQAWTAANLEKAREAKRAWHAAHSVMQNLKVKQWRKNNPEAVRASLAARRARKRNAPGTYTAADIQRIGDTQKWRCGWCAIPCKHDYHVDHVVSLAKGGSNWPRNLLISCAPCNAKKNAADPLDFARRLGKLL